MPSLGSYLLGAAQLAVLLGALGFTAHRLRACLLPAWGGAPARLVEAIAAVAILIWLAQLLGTFGLLYAGTLLVLAVLLAGLASMAKARTQDQSAPPAGGTGPVGESPLSLGAMTLAISAVSFQWLTVAKHALDRGIFNFDSLWYHMPFAAEMAKSHSVTGMHHVETVFTNWFYPQNSELLHAVGILLTGRDTLSLFLNLGWLAVAFLAAYCVGRPYGRGSLTVVAAAILLGCHTLVVRDPGSAKNDLAAAALLLASIAILVEAWHRRPLPSPPAGVVEVGSPGGNRPQPPAGAPAPAGFEPWALAAAGLAAGLAAGTRVTVLAMAAALTVAVALLASRGRRLAATAWWSLAALAGGVYWYLRNLVVAGNPIPELKGIGPISLPHPERLQPGRPDFSIAHYATDTGVWREYFAPGLHEAFGGLWPLVVGGAALAAFLALVAGRDRIVRAVGAVALVGLLAYLVTPLSAAGAEGEPVAFGINIRYVVPALLAGIVLVPLPRALDGARARLALLAVLLLVYLVTNRPDDALHDGARLFALLGVILAVAVPALILLARERGASAGVALAGAAALAAAVVALGYPVQRDYLEERFRNRVAAAAIPGMGLDDAYRWAQGVEDSRIGLAGTTAGFAGYGFYGRDLSNDVVYLGQEGPHGAFSAIPTCSAFRAAVNEADLDYLVTAPFLNFLHPDEPIPSPERRWLRGERAVTPLLGGEQVTVWRLRGDLDPAACGAANAPLREVPRTPER
jgi:hypothetical protein